MSDDELRRRLDRLAHEAPTPDQRRATTVRAARRRARVGAAIAGATGVAVVVLAVLAVNVVIDRTPIPEPPLIGDATGSVRPAPTASPAPPAEPTGTIAFWSDSLSGGGAVLTRIAADGTRRVTVADLSISTSRLSLSPDGSQVVFDHGLGEGVGQLEVMDVGTRQRRPIVTVGNPQSPDWSPDGKRIVFSTGSGALFTVPREGGDSATPVRRLGPDAYMEGSSPSWSPQGDAIAFIDPKTGEIEVATATGGEPETTVYAQGRASSLDWGTGGVVASVAPAGGGDASLVLIDPKDGSADLLPFRGEGWSPALSPDGAFVAFVGNADGQQDLFLLRVADGAVTQLTDDRSLELSPVWAPSS